MKSTSAFCLVALLLLSSTLSMAQIDDKIQARKVKNNITLGTGADKKSLRYTTDTFGYIDSKATDVLGTPNVAIVGNQLNISRQFLNPVRYAVNISENELKDPMIEDANKQITLIATLFTQVGALELPPPSSSTNAPLSRAKAMRGASAGQVASLEASLNKIRSQRMLQLAFDLLQNNECYDVASLNEFFNYVGNVDEYCAKHNTQALSTLESMRAFELPIGQTLSGGANVEELNKPISDALLELVVFQNNATLLLPKIESFTAQLKVPAGENSCNEVKVLTARTIADYVSEKKDELNKRKDINELLNKQNQLLKTEMIGYLTNSSKPITLQPGTIKEVTVTIKERIFEFSSEKTVLVTSEKDLIAGKITVHKHYPILLEASVGVLYAPEAMEFPEFTVSNVNNKNTIVKSKVSSTHIVAAGLLNVVPNIGPSPVHPMLQVGVGTGNERPTLYGGLGFRFGKPLNKFAITLGYVGYWTRALEDGVLEGSEIQEAAALNEKLKFEGLKSRFAFGIQRSF